MYIPQKGLVPKEDKGTKPWVRCNSTHMAFLPVSPSGGFHVKIRDCSNILLQVSVLTEVISD